MPAYDYRCTACRKKFQLVHSISEHEKKRVKCPKCSSSKVERVFSAAFVKTTKKS